MSLIGSQECIDRELADIGLRDAKQGETRRICIDNSVGVIGHDAGLGLMGKQLRQATLSFFEGLL